MLSVGEDTPPNDRYGLEKLVEWESQPVSYFVTDDLVGNHSADNAIGIEHESGGIAVTIGHYPLPIIGCGFHLCQGITEQGLVRARTDTTQAVMSETANRDGIIIKAGQSVLRDGTDNPGPVICSPVLTPSFGAPGLNWHLVLEA